MSVGKDHSDLSPIRRANQMTALDLQVIEQGAQILDVVLELPGLLRLLTQQLSPEVVEYAPVVLAKERCLQHPRLRRHHHTVEKNDWLAVANDVVVNADTVEFLDRQWGLAAPLCGITIFSDSAPESEPNDRAWLIQSPS